MSNMLRIGNREISYEQAKGMLFPELIPQKGNEEMLSQHPHDKVEDLAVVYRLDLASGNGTMMSARVNQAILDAFGVSAEQMKQDALENAPKTHPATFRSMEEVLGAMMGGMPVPTPDEGQPRLYVASTETMNRGAGVIAYPDFLQEASEKIGGNFFILPSSIHELLLKGELSHYATLGTDPRGNLTRIDNVLAGIEGRIETTKQKLESLYQQQEDAKTELGKPFPQEQELQEKSARLAELDAALNMDEPETAGAIGEIGDDDPGEDITDAAMVAEKSSVMEYLKNTPEGIFSGKQKKHEEEVL